MGVIDTLFEKLFDLDAENFSLEDKDYMLTAYYMDDRRMSVEEILEDEEECDSVQRELEDIEVDGDSLQDMLKRLKVNNLERRTKDSKDKIELQKLVHEAKKDMDWIEIENKVRKRKS